MRIPAKRAARTEPIEAMRQSAVEQATYTRKRLIVSLALIALGARMLVGAAVLVGLGRSCCSSASSSPAR